MNTCKNLYVLAACLICNLLLAQPAIPSPAFGINLWMPDHYITGSSTYPGGAANFKNIQTMVDNLSTQMVRVGGGDIDLNGVSIATATTTNDYARFIQQIKYRVPNAKFMIQIPYKSSSYGFSLTDVATLVSNIKSIFPSDVFYYSIGNEWDRYSSAEKAISNVASKFISYSQRIKETDPSAIILSPNFTSFYATDGTYTYYQELFNPSGLYYIGGYISSGTQTGKPYCDIIDLHTYPSETNGTSNQGLYGLTSGNFSATQTAMQNHPQGKFANELANNTSSGYNGLQLLINNCSRGTGSTYPLQIAYSEINVTYQNPTLSSQSSTSIYENTFDGLACRSFFGGQWLMEMFCSFLVNSSDKAAFMIPWSPHESGGDGINNSDGEDLSLTRGTANSTTDPTPVSTYYHYEMLADNLRNCTNIFKPTTNSTSIKAFGAYNTITGANGKHVVVLINQTGSAYNSTTIQLNNTTPSGNYVVMNFPSGPSVGYSINMDANATMVLIFNKSGEILRQIDYKLSYGKTGVPTYTDNNAVTNNYAVMIDLGPDMSGCCQVPLQAYPTIPSATYTWYKSSDDFTSSIGTGSGYYVPNGDSYTYKCVVTYNSQTAWDYVKGSNASSNCCRIVAINGSPDQNNNSFSVVPNPAQETATIYYALPESALAGTISIADISGNIVKSVSVSPNDQSVDLDCKLLSNGMYFYSLKVGEKTLSCKKLVIAK